MLKFRIEVVPFIVAAACAGIVLLGVLKLFHANWPTAVAWGAGLFIIGTLYFLYFFRDPERVTPVDPAAIVSAGEGHIASVANLDADAFRRLCVASGLDIARVGPIAQREVTRISVFLSPLNVHVNRAPIGGRSTFLGYFPGKHIFTFDEKSSEENQHNAILIEGARTACLLYQIVGPVCRRVVYWPDHDKPVDLQKGDRIGMMKFGSRLDLYFPREDIEVIVKPGDFVRAGETVIARLAGEATP